MEEVSTVDNKKDIVPCNDVIHLSAPYDSAPSDNGHPLGEEVQERPFDRCEK